MSTSTPDTASLLQELVDHTKSWDWEGHHVGQSYVESNETQLADISINDIVEAGTVLIASGPSDLEAASKNAGGFRIVPIGMVETAQISMNKPLSRIFEIGSLLSYIIPGRAVGGISLSRVFFDGPSLLKVLYMGEVEKDSADTSNKYAKFMSSKETKGPMAHIGSGNLAMNLASRFFNEPAGLAFFFRDQANDEVSQIYFEGCRVGTWNLGISANMNVLTEAVNIEFVKCRPIVTAATIDNPAKGRQLTDKNIVSSSATSTDDVIA
jgi:hypothetical protein